ncbi:MAG: MarC family protein [Bacteroidaceae bacterium]|nr:MarC family protein [Bacteroidaceae bacterium]
MTLDYLVSRLSWQQAASAFIVLFAIIDVLGSSPIFISLKNNGRPTNALKATLISTALLVGFYYAGDAVLKLFSVDIQSFAVAGSLIIFLLALEMLLDIEIFKFTGPLKEATLIPVVFPLIAGAGSFTTLLSLKAEYATINIMIGLALNMLFVYIVISAADKVERFVSRTAIYVLRKFFGVILMAIAVKLFAANITTLMSNLG